MSSLCLHLVYTCVPFTLIILRQCRKQSINGLKAQITKFKILSGWSFDQRYFQFTIVHGLYFDRAFIYLRSKETEISHVPYTSSTGHFKVCHVLAYNISYPYFSLILSWKYSISYAGSQPTIPKCVLAIMFTSRIDS